MNRITNAKNVSLPLQKVWMTALLWKARHLVQWLSLTCCLIIWLILFFSLSSCGCLGWGGRYCGNRNDSVCVVWGTRFWDLSEQRWATNRERFWGCEKNLCIYSYSSFLLFIDSKIKQMFLRMFITKMTFWCWNIISFIPSQEYIRILCLILKICNNQVWFE